MAIRDLGLDTVLFENPKTIWGYQYVSSVAIHLPFGGKAYLRLIYMGMKADLKARKECNRFNKKYYLCKNMCERCDAVQLRTNQDHPMNYKNMSRSAPYLETCIDHDEYIRTSSEISPWSLVTGWQLENVFFDFMHLVYLGTARSHVPSALKILRHLGYFYEEGESEELFLRRTSLEMRATCKKHGYLGSVCLHALGPLNMVHCTFEIFCQVLIHKMRSPLHFCGVFRFGKYIYIFKFIRPFLFISFLPLFLRLYLPRRALSVANCGSFGLEEYPELGTRFKAAHVKIMCWWIALKIQELSQQSET